MIRFSRLGFFSLVLIATVFACTAPEPTKVAVKRTFKPVLGVCTRFKNAPLVKKAGFAYIEENTRSFLKPLDGNAQYEKWKKKAGRLVVPVYSCNCFLPGSLKSVGPKADHAGVLKYAETAFRRAKEWGIKVIVFGSSASRRIPKGFEPSKAEAQFVALLKKMGPLAGKYGITVCLEPLNKKEDNLINSVSKGAEFVRRVNHPNIRLLADFYHMAVEGEPPQALIDAGEYLCHCHAAELKDRASPGKNGFDFRPYLEALAKAGYKGRISVECRWRHFKEELPKSYQYLKKQLDPSRKGDEK